jgi:hypothetical protein
MYTFGIVLALCVGMIKGFSKKFASLKIFHGKIKSGGNDIIT